MKKKIDDLILLVEDSDEDFVAVQRVFKKSGCEARLMRAENAEEALDFLFRRGKYNKARIEENRPSLILLDLNLPGLDGRDLLRQLKTDDRVKEIPVVILSTSNDPRDVVYCYRNGANGYQIKTVGFNDFFNSIKSMISYWFETAIIPSEVN